MGNTISYQDTPVTLSLGDKGVIQGIQRDDKARRFTGIPYALPPTGERRWRKPQPLPPSYKYTAPDGVGPFDATEFRSKCPQRKFQATNTDVSAGSFSEDCLVVNIWTPVPREDDDPGKKWPVMLWIHGGWFQIGDPSQDPGMDATELVSTGGLNSIVVSIGYRLNVFGFLSGQELLTESGGVSAGNFGLWDQRMAAEWVHDNISFFGGDPGNVTIAGRSAGAYGVEAQMLYELRGAGSRSLYRRMFLDSNAIPAQPKSLADIQVQFDELCRYLGIEPHLQGDKKLAVLRSKTSQELLDAIPHLENHTFRPVTDDLFVHDGMIEYLRSREFADDFLRRGYRLLVGDVANEETLYAEYSPPTTPTIDSLRTQVNNYYAPDVTERVLHKYPLPSTSSDLDAWKAAYGRIVSDGQVRAPSRALVHHLALNGVPLRNLWRYQIAYRMSFITEKVSPMSFGVAHAMDKPFWNFSLCYGPTTAERQLMDDWIKILVAFVQGDDRYDFGTTKISDMVVATPQGQIEVQEDKRWDELLEISQLFAGR